MWKEDDIELRYVTTTLMAADIYTKAFQDAVKWTNLCEQINIVGEHMLGEAHIHALHARLLVASTLITGKKQSADVQNLMPEEIHDWDSTLGWHERENIHYNIVREPKLHRIYIDDKGSRDTKFGKRTTWLKTVSGGFVPKDGSIGNHFNTPEHQSTCG